MLWMLTVACSVTAESEPDSGCLPSELVALYPDADGDGWGLEPWTVEACEGTPGLASRGGDCDDEAASRHPGAEEACNNVDDDCDGEVDEGAVVEEGFVDADGDGHGDPERPGGGACGEVAVVGDDCDDADPARLPGAPEFCDGRPNDCDAADWSAESEAGLVSFAPSSGPWVDLTARPPGPTELATDGTVWFCEGVHEGAFVVHAWVTLAGLPDVSATLRGGAGASTVRVESGELWLWNLTLSGGDGTAVGADRLGGVLYARDSEVWLEDATLTDGQATDGGGAAFISTAVTARNAVFQGNASSRNGGGLLVEDGSFVGEGVSFDANACGEDGGGAWLSGTVDFVCDGCSWLGNVGGHEGGGLHAADVTGEFSTTGATVMENTGVHGGGWSFARHVGRIEAVDASFLGNEAIVGGAVRFDSTVGGVRFEDTAFSDNRGESYGGGIFATAADGMELLGCTIEGGIQEEVGTGGGAGAYLYQTPIVAASTIFRQNTAGGGAGALWVQGGPVELNDVSFKDNRAIGPGGVGGAWLAARTVMVGGAFSGNLADGGSAASGGFVADGFQMALTEVVVTGNVGDFGGGARVRNGGDLDLDLTLFSANRADGGGGGLYLEEGDATCAGDASVFAGFLANLGGEGGGVGIGGGTFASESCDFGADAATDNFDEDGAVSDTSTRAGAQAWGDDASFRCTRASCSE
jgi:hypothetical protein